MPKDHGVDAVFKELAALDKKLRNSIIRKGQREGCKILAAEIKSRAPVESGRTQKSVKVRAGRRKKDQISTVVEISGGHDEPFIGFVEFGTAHQAANPFIRGSADDKTADVVEAVAKAIEAGIKKS